MPQHAGQEDCLLHETAARKVKDHTMHLTDVFSENFQPGSTALRLVTRSGVACRTAAGRSSVHIAPDVLRQLAREAFRDVNFYFRTSHLEHWSAALDDPAASANDRFVAAALLKNAAISAEGILPTCQDTGTATVVAYKGQGVITDGDDASVLEEGIAAAYAAGSLRASQVAPLSMFDERNTGTNLPAQIDIYAAPGDDYRFLFMAKGGGSTNKTGLFMQTKALLNEAALTSFLREKVQALGVAACPPYYLALVVGGTSPEFNLKLLKLATAGALDHLPTAADGSGAPYRDRGWEERLLQIAAETGLGAQFGGKHLALDARVIRCARHGGSCPVSLGVSCSAHRNALGRIGADGAFLEDFDRDPARFLPKALDVLGRTLGGNVPRINLDAPLREVCEQLLRYPAGTLVLLSGPLVLARDAAHARFHERLRAGQALPDYLARHPIYYAGPAATPPGQITGSLGPTTAERMDGYLPELIARGLSLITLGKGNRSAAVATACRQYGGCCLGTIGGAAAWLAKEHVVHSDVIDYADLGMEAVRRIDVRDLPAFIAVDCRGNAR
jgi:fumarate hydratase, class I